MNYVFKALFNQSEDVEAAYYILKNKNLVTDIDEPKLNILPHKTFSAKIAYALEGNTMLASTEISNNISSTTLLGVTDPRVTFTPVLFNKKQASSEDTCFLYGHCRKKDINSVIECLKRNGAYSVLTSNVLRQSHILH